MDFLLNVHELGSLDPDSGEYIPVRMSLDESQTINVKEVLSNNEIIVETKTSSDDRDSTMNEKDTRSQVESEGTSSRMSVEQIFAIGVQNIQSNVETEEESEQRINQSRLSKVSYWNLLKIVIILGYSALFLSPQLLIPRNNPIYYPDTWYRNIFLIVQFAASAGVVRSLLELFVFTKEKSMINIGVFMKLWLSVVAPMFSLIYILNYIWTFVMELQPPIPFGGLMVNLCVWIIYNCSIWCRIVFPSELRNKDEFRRQMNSYMIYDLWWFFMNLQRDVLSFAFTAIPAELQFIFAVLIPMVKEMNKRLLLKLVLKIVGKEDTMANAFLSVRLNIHYALFVAIRMNGAEVQTVISVIFVDFFMQLWMTRQIIQMDKKVTPDINEINSVRKRKQKGIMKLLLAELVEGLVPLAYAIGFAMAFYGPNGSLTGNVLSNIWAYKKVNDFGRLITIQLILFVVDCLSVLFNTFLLYKFVNMNFMKEFCKAIKDYWIFLTIQLGNTITYYFAFNDISSGTDMTTKFSWITTEGRLRFIYNSTDLNEEEKVLLLFNNTFT